MIDVENEVKEFMKNWIDEVRQSSERECNDGNRNVLNLENEWIRDDWTILSSNETGSFHYFFIIYLSVCVCVENVSEWNWLSIEREQVVVVVVVVYVYSIFHLCDFNDNTLFHYMCVFVWHRKHCKRDWDRILKESLNLCIMNNTVCTTHCSMK